MLAEQAYGGHTSIHDDAMAEKLGSRAGPIEGPTHFSQFVPLLAQLWGLEWFERGCLSAHYQNMVVEGEAVRAFIEGAPGATASAGPLADPGRQQIRMVDGPLFVGEDYLIRREIVALSESKRTESYWVRTRIFNAAGRTLMAEVLRCRPGACAPRERGGP